MRHHDLAARVAELERALVTLAIRLADVTAELERARSSPPAAASPPAPTSPVRPRPRRRRRAPATTTPKRRPGRPRKVPPAEPSS